MLEILRIKNLALIEDAELEFSHGLNVITGESGAGKSIILKSLDFVLGEKIPPSMVRPGKEKAYVEAMFVLEGEEILIKREILQNSGRSRIYVNDSLSSKTRLKELRNRLIIYTSQHEQHKLLKPEYHTHLLDQYLPPELLKQKHSLIEDIIKIHRKIKHIETEIKDIDLKKDFLNFQLEEIKKVSPKPKEDEILLQKREELKNSAKLGEKIQQALNLLCSPENSLSDNFLKLHGLVQEIALLDPDFEEILNEMEHIKETISNLENILKSYPIGIDDIFELEKIEARLWELEQLKKRLNKSLDEILSLQYEIESNISKRDELALELKELKKREKELLSTLKQTISIIGDKRKAISEDLSEKLKRELIDMGFDKQMEIYFQFFSKEISPDIDILEERARLMWRPNPGQEIQPLEKIVSGGELSRLFLALMSIMASEDMPTLIFDEIDTGIGGLTLTKVGKKIKNLSNQHQVILVTHWPQLACLAEKHFKVHKEVIKNQTYIRCKPLSLDEVRKELSRMAGGGNQGEALANQLLKERQ